MSTRTIPKLHQWRVGLRTHLRESQPGQHGVGSALMVKGSQADVKAAAEGSASRISKAGPACLDPLEAICCTKSPTRKFDSIAADMTREEGKTLPEPRRSAPVDQHLALLRRRGRADAGMMVPCERDRVHMLTLREPMVLSVLSRPGIFRARSGVETCPALVAGNTVIINLLLLAPLKHMALVEALP